MENDRRWGKRFKTKLPVMYGKDDLIEEGVIQDVAVFGLFTMTGKLYPQGSVLRFRILTIPERKQIDLEGTVQWSSKKPNDVKWLVKGAGMGIKIKRFLAGEEHYEKICQDLCQRAAHRP